MQNPNRDDGKDHNDTPRNPEKPFAAVWICGRYVSHLPIREETDPCTGMDGYCGSSAKKGSNGLCGPGDRMKSLTIALAGNPNVGKSTLFNALTGLRQHTGNWPGKTVEIARGKMRTKEYLIDLVDLPGTYALDGASEDERIAAEFIESGEADCTIVVCDGSALERNLILAIQILQRTQSVIVCVNLMDEAKRRGFSLDAQRLSDCLGVPVVLTAAGRKEGINELKKMLANLDELRFSPRAWDDPVQEAGRIAAECVSRDREDEPWRLMLDRILVSRRRGIPILLFLLFVIVFLTVWGANYPSGLLEKLFDKGYGLLTRCMDGLPWWLSGILIDGIYATAARVIAVMLPPMAIFFPLFTVLEDVGYLPRMAFLLDGVMQRCGGCGRQALTFCMGLGCNAVGVTGCRIIDSPRERLAAILTNAMIPCNGRFPTLIVLAGLLLPTGMDGLCVGAFVILGILGAMAATGVLSKTVLRHESSAFLMELPPLRMPRLGQIIIRSLLDRTLYVAGRALGVAAPAGALLWLLSNSSALATMSRVLDPVGLLLGMNGMVLLAFVLSLPANELLIPVLLLMLSGAGNLQEAGSVSMQILLGNLSVQTVICTMIFTVFHWPCATTMLTIRKETGSNIKTAVAMMLPTAVGVLLCMMINLLL